MKDGAVSSILTKAFWIWAGNPGLDIVNCYAQFRKGFELASVPRKAPLFITADQSYRLYINGRYVCRGAARGMQLHWPYDEVDVAGYLRKGENVVAIRAFNPGRSCFQYVSQGMAGLLLGAEWGKFSLVSDKSWKARRQAGIARGTVPVSVQLFDQEHVDLRLEADDWMMPGYDDSGWKINVTSRPFGVMPWNTLEPRMIPLLSEQVIRPVALIGVGSGRSSAGYQATRDVVALRVGEDRTHSPVSPGNVPIRVEATGKGGFRSYLLDFGRTVLGNPAIIVKGARGGEMVDTLHVETVEKSKLEPHLVPNEWCGMAFGNRMICRPGENRHVFYHPFGFRYFELTVRDAEGALDLDVELNWIGYPMDRKGRFESSDTMLENIWETCAWTQQCCAIDSYVDTPWREQAQWWGDARVQAWNTFHLSGDARLLRRGIHCIASQTTPEGLTYGHAPTAAHECILPDFTLIWMMTMWDYYWQTGSVEPVKTHRRKIDAALGYFDAHTDKKTGLVGYDRRYWLFLDWTDIFKNGYSSVYNLWLLLTLQKLAILFKLAGDTRRAGQMKAWAGRVSTALRQLLSQDGLLMDGIAFDGKLAERTSVQSQTLAIMTGLNPAGEQAMLEKVLVPYIKEKLAMKGLPSSYWCTYAFTVLAERGYGSEVVDYIRKHWAPMVEHGTTFEVFDPQPGGQSFSHAWSAHPLYHLVQIIGGIRQTGPAWKRVRYAPCFAGDRGSAAVPVSAGLISGSWKKIGAGKVAVEISVPRGVCVEVVLPGMKIQTVKGPGKKAFSVAC